MKCLKDCFSSLLRKGIFKIPSEEQIEQLFEVEHMDCEGTPFQFCLGINDAVCEDNSNLNETESKTLF